MRTTPILSTLALGAVVAFAATASLSADESWHANLEEGVAAARKSGKPVLVVTAWKSGI